MASQGRSLPQRKNRVGKRKNTLKPQRNDSRPRYRLLNQEQEEAMHCLEQNSICFLLGPAGSAKTFLATAWALDQFFDRDLSIKISRPTVQQGINLGYLPGDAKEKVSPFLVPIFDSIEKMCADPQRAKAATEILPLALIRGRTIENATLIVDESQNLSYREILAICTRIGPGGQIIFCGDTSQSDQQEGQCRLEEASQKLDGLSAEEYSIGSFKFTEESIIRHPLIAEIIRRLTS